jgi:acyl carrier protein
MTVLAEVTRMLLDVLQLGTGKNLDGSSALMGAMPEFDSLAVVSILTALEEHYGFIIDDDDINAEVFTSVGSLVEFVEHKLSGQ